MLISEIKLALEVGRQLDALGVRWLVGGSLASSILGEPRATADVDLVADLRRAHVAGLYAALVDTYYIDEDAAKAAVQMRSSFNVIQLASMTKIDIYCSGNDALAREEMLRLQLVDVAGQRVPCASAEDIILHSSSGSSRAVASPTASGATSAAWSRCKAMVSTAPTSSAMQPTTASSSSCSARCAASVVGQQAATT